MQEDPAWQSVMWLRTFLYIRQKGMVHGWYSPLPCCSRSSRWHLWACSSNTRLCCFAFIAKPGSEACLTCSGIDGKEFTQHIICVQRTSYMYMYMYLVYTPDKIWSGTCGSPTSPASLWGGVVSCKGGDEEFYVEAMYTTCMYMLEAWTPFSLLLLQEKWKL